MSTQRDGGIEFSIVSESDQQHLRLLELPAELLQVVTSKDPPILQLKSSIGGDSVLCTQDKTYNLRQVSTSNTVLLAESAVLQDGADGLPQSGLQAIARPQSTLEVLSTTNLSAVPYIKSALPVFTSTGQYSSKDGILKQDLFSNIPLSDAACERGWIELACFELGESRHSVVPSTSIQLRAWRSVMEVASASGVDLTEALSESRISTIIDPENEWPDALSRAVLHSMTAEPTESDSLQLDDQICAKHVGLALLKDLTHTSKAPISSADFKKAWADLLPETWRSLAELSLIEGCYSLENGSKEVIYLESSNKGATNANGVAPEEAKSTLGAKRKWHEKFRASKKTS